MNEYKYYKIIRDDGKVFKCTVLNWLENYFIRLFGEPTQWNESNETYTLKLKRSETEIPVSIVAATHDNDFRIELSKQEYKEIELYRCY